MEHTRRLNFDYRKKFIITFLNSIQEYQAETSLIFPNNLYDTKNFTIQRIIDYIKNNFDDNKWIEHLKKMVMNEVVEDHRGSVEICK